MADALLDTSITMGDAWTRDRVTQMAPDAASAKAGEGLASARKWVSLASDERAVWGECQGSGAKPYQVQVDLAEVAFKCSCPSRKFPCKHGIGLMLLYAGGAVAAGEQPAWVAQWLESRSQRKEKKAQPIDLSPEAAARRAETAEKRRVGRLANVLDGMSDLRVWLEDFVRAGLAAAPSRGPKYFEERARRLVDAQAPGAARLVREIASAAVSGNGWQQRTLEAASLTYLLSEAAGRLDSLPAELREDVLATLGVATEKESLESAPAVSDIWQVIGREIEVEANLKTQRTHLFGARSRRPALLLDFAYGNVGLNSAAAAGTLFPAELVFYPGNSLRAAVKNSTADVAPLQRLGGFDSITAMLDAHAALVADRPWMAPVGLPLTGVTPMVEDGRWWIVDGAGDAIALTARGRNGWIALAVSGGRPIDVGITTDGRSATLLSVVADGAFTAMSSGEESS